MTTCTKKSNLQLKGKSNFLSINSRHDGTQSLSDLSTDEDQTDVQTNVLASSNKPVHYENTYKVYPEKKLSVGKLEVILKEVLNKHLKNECYDLAKSRETCENISQEIKEEVKELGVPRYKLVVLVHLVENRQQGIEISSRCVWSEHFDNFAAAHFENTSLFAQAVVFAIYYE